MKKVLSAFALMLLLVAVTSAYHFNDEVHQNEKGFCTNKIDDDNDTLVDYDDVKDCKRSSGGGQCVVYPECRDGKVQKPLMWINPIRDSAHYDIDSKYCYYNDKNASLYKCEPVAQPQTEEPTEQPEEKPTAQPTPEPKPVKKGFWARLKSLFT